MFWPLVLLVITIAIMILICIVIGRALCAWACPIGFFQDLFTKVRELLRFNSKEFSLKTHNRMVGVKYAVLFLVLISAISIGISATSDEMMGSLYISNFPEGTSQTAPYCQVCPTPVIYYFSNSFFLGADLGLSNPVNVAMLLIFFGFAITAIIIPRFWCRYFCPLGAFSSFFNKVSLLSIRKDQTKCTKCKYCVNACPTRVQVIRDEIKDDNVTDMNCDFCLECIESCPEKALSLSVGKKAIYRGGKKDWWEQPPLKS
jgi:polyferredoxin